MPRKCPVQPSSRRPDRLRELLLNVTLSITSLFLFLGLAEGLCRLKYHPEKTVYSGIFEYDKDKVYALKKNVKDGSFAGRRCQTNSFGYRDAEIPVEKGKDAIRVLVIGDSVTFGHGVSEADTYSDQLERMLNRENPGHHFDVINTAVPGNSPFQEYYDLKRGLVFDPDIVVIQFVLNDLVEPYKIFARYGGKGIDYHGVADVPYWHYLLSQKSALYLFLKDLYATARFRSTDRTVIQAKAQTEVASLDWNAAAYEPTDDKIREAWTECLRWMQKEVDLCRSKGIDCILLVSPVEFQLVQTSKRYAQKRLREFALVNNIDFIDILPAIEEAARQAIARKDALHGEISYEELTSSHADDFKAAWRYYFLDYDHYNRRGHAMVAQRLLEVIQGILARKGAPPASSGG
jgi:lysophospholipase L1-like esterase